MAKEETQARARAREDEEALDTTAQIETPEQVTFRFRVAGPATRALAYFLDTVFRGLFLATLGVVLLIAGAVDRDGLFHASVGLWLLAVFFAEWGYFVLFELLWSGASPGKRILRLRVVTIDGRPLGLVESALRNLLRGVDALPTGYVLGVLATLTNRRFQRVGDLVAGTMVVLEHADATKDALSGWDDITEEQLARLPSRVPLSPQELAAIELLLRRAQTLPRLRVADLAELVAPTFARRMGVSYKDPTRFLAMLHRRALDRRRA